MALETDHLEVWEEDTLKDKYLIFSLGKEEYGIDICHVMEIIGIQPITPIPEMPAYLKGIINLRGKIIPIMDVRLRFRKEPREYDDRTCIIIVVMQDLSVGLVVDEVAEVLTLKEGDIVPPPQVHKGIQNRYVKGIGKAGEAVKLLLDCEKLLTDEEMDSLHEII